MIKRMLCIFLVLILIASPVTVCAQTRTGTHISSYAASLAQGSSKGTIKVTYRVVATDNVMNVIGVRKIDVYNASGTLYTTVTGTVNNGLIKQRSLVADGTYTISCVAGNSYYCVVTFLSRDNTGSETRTYTTGTAIARPS